MYSWCSDDLLSAGVPPIPPQQSIPELIDPDDPTRPPLPLVPTSASGSNEPISEFADPRVRTIAAYWHAGWRHTRPVASLREGAAQRLIAAAHSLPDGFGLAVWDGWRDPLLQSALYDAAYSDPDLPVGFVNAPRSDPATPPPHATGGTVDVTLTWKNIALSLGTGFDDFVPLARARSLEAAEEGTAQAQARDLRRLLRSVMTGAGFVQLASEWWHFEYGTRLWAAVNSTIPLYPAGHPVQALGPQRN